MTIVIFSRQKFEPSMTNNPLSNLPSSDDSREMSLKPHSFQPQPTNHIEEINLDSMVWKLFLTHDSLYIYIPCRIRMKVDLCVMKVSHFNRMNTPHTILLDTESNATTNIDHA